MFYATHLFTQLISPTNSHQPSLTNYFSSGGLPSTPSHADTLTLANYRLLSQFYSPIKFNHIITPFQFVNNFDCGSSCRHT